MPRTLERLGKHPAEDRWISLGPGASLLPERLLLAHARGSVLMITGAGTSMQAGLPSFAGLVLQVYEALDQAVWRAMRKPAEERDVSELSSAQLAEIARFDRGDYDVVLGMLERRIDVLSGGDNAVRRTIDRLIRSVPDGVGGLRAATPAPIHKALISLADRGGVTTIATTNFDRLLQGRSKHLRTYALGDIPRPGRGHGFSGVLHIHGVIGRSPGRVSDLVVNDRDFGEVYLRRRLVPDFIYDSARLFNLVMVGYSANDAPMRYLLNAVAADGSRFDDLKERFAFIPQPTSSEPSIEDWQARGITPIPYERDAGHRQLLLTLEAWAKLSAVNGNVPAADKLISRSVATPRSRCTDQSKDFVDHMFRRATSRERMRISALMSRAKADTGWLQALCDVVAESHTESGE